MKAYTAAQALARNRFQTIEGNPALKAALDGVEPDQFVRKYVLGGNANHITNLVGMLGKVDPGAVDALRSSAVGWIKRQSLNGASDENGVFSQAAYNRAVNDPYMSARLKALMTPDQIDTLQRLGRTAENALSFPKAAAVNTSNTTSSAANIIKSEVQGGPLNQILDLAKKVPGVSSAAQNLQAGQQTKRLGDLIADAQKPDVGGTVKPGATSLAAVARLADLTNRAATRAGAEYGEDKQRRASRAGTR